jgi:hypothetical protein
MTSQTWGLRGVWTENGRMRYMGGEVRQDGNTSEMAGDMITLGTGCAAVLPLAGEAEVVGALAANMVIAEMVVEGLWVEKGLSAVAPETFVGRRRGRGRTSGGGGGRGRKSSHVEGQEEVLGVHDVLKGHFCCQDD